MNITEKNPGQLHTNEIVQISELVSIGFGQSNSVAMYNDTLQHIKTAETIQLATDGDYIKGFSMVRRCLWRASA